MLSANQGCAHYLFGALPMGVCCAFGQRNVPHGDWMVTFILLSLGPVVDGFADGMTGLMSGYQNSCLKEQKVGRGRVRGSSEFRSFALPFFVLSLRMVLN